MAEILDANTLNLGIVSSGKYTHYAIVPKRSLIKMPLLHDQHTTLFVKLLRIKYLHVILSKFILSL